MLVAADLVGIRDVFKIGGAQAIAAMAFGTETVPRVYKLFGPGVCTWWRRRSGRRAGLPLAIDCPQGLGSVGDC